ncbi:NUDIX hydrolase [Paenisporosarcina sp. TG20]|uniref:NUDIX hydrolase n=1 Tax=Paenisporosarcina sp. TG20 TaxID=1211706 RepID=UPI0002DE39DF|nr:NUDIX hydrolase [Paenisporosarcina sp. TG20]
MFNWKGASGVCINEDNQLLMVLQAAHGEEPKWTVPSGGLEDNETFEQCCVREFEEETGLKVEVISKLQDKSGSNNEYKITYELQYFRVKVLSGELTVQDPDEFILDIAWKSLEELEQLDMSYPKDLLFFRDLLAI